MSLSTFFSSLLPSAKCDAPEEKEEKVEESQSEEKEEAAEEEEEEPEDVRQLSLALVKCIKLTATCGLTFSLDDVRVRYDVPTDVASSCSQRRVCRVCKVCSVHKALPALPREGRSR